MQLNRELHQEIADLLADNTAPTVILGILRTKGIEMAQAQELMETVARLRNKALEASRARQAGGHQPPPTVINQEPIPVPQEPVINPMFQNMFNLSNPPQINRNATPQPADRIPHITNADHSLMLDLGDRQGRVVMVSEHPTVAVIEGFLSIEECDEILRLAPEVSRSNAVDVQTGVSVVHPARTSSGTFFARGQNPTVKAIEERIARVMHWPVEYGEGIQVVRYDIGQEYTPHFDYFDPAHPGSAKIVEKSGNRLGTVIMYLEEPTKGGSTYFPDAGGMRIYPKKGSILFFSYDRPHESTRTRHAGAPVIEGVKWIATKWLRDRPF